jgi:hypothetical protein
VRNKKNLQNLLDVLTATLTKNTRGGYEIKFEGNKLLGLRRLGVYFYFLSTDGNEN